MAIENVQQLLTEQLGKNRCDVINTTAMTGKDYYAIHFVTESVIASITATNATTAAVLTAAAVGSQLAGSAQSFSQARKQKAKQREAEATADKYMADARRSLEKNYMESLAIQKEPYELEREAALVAGAQATEALRESDRGMGRVGAIYGQQQQAQRQIASAMGQEMFNLDYLTAQEESRLRDIGTQLDLGEVTGAQLEAANAEERRQQQLRRS